MESRGLSQHISSSFNVELEGLRGQVLNMGGMVEEQLENALEAFSKLDYNMARQVVERDYKVNHAEVTIDEDCSQIIARRQPAASDLRFIIMVIKTITDLERIGDEASKIGRLTLDFQKNSIVIDPQVHGSLQRLGALAVAMLQKTLDAFARMDVETSLEIKADDRKINEEYDSILRSLMGYMHDDANHIQAGLTMMWAARAIERVGDHTKNIGEYVVYMVMGKDIRHTAPDSLRQ